MAKYIMRTTREATPSLAVVMPPLQPKAVVATHNRQGARSPHNRPAAKIRSGVPSVVHTMRTFGCRSRV